LAVGQALPIFGSGVQAACKTTQPPTHHHKAAQLGARNERGMEGESHDGEGFKEASKSSGGARHSFGDTGDAAKR
jgi:hypothetical protein